MTPLRIRIVDDHESITVCEQDAEAEECREQASEPSAFYQFMVWLCGSSVEVRQ